MTEQQKQQRQYALTTSCGVCAVCGKSLNTANAQGAHRIANTQANRKKWGSLIIDHPLNVAMVCSLKCNDACNIGYRPYEALRLAFTILGAEMRKYEVGK
ncbi:hypothetical protein [Treponema lecithinolyticum]